MARFYSIDIDTDLFGAVVLTRRWGRIGTLGQGRAMAFDLGEEAASASAQQLERAKRKRGYR